MSQVLHLKRDPAWLSSSSPLDFDSAILLQGDAQDGQVSVPAALLVASSPLVRNILSAGHLPPSFSTPIISIPSVSVDVLVSVVEMLVLRMASMDRTKLSKVRAVFEMMGIDIKTEIVLDNLVSVVHENCIQAGQMESENVNLEVVKKVKKEPKSETPNLLVDRSEGQSNCYTYEETNDAYSYTINVTEETIENIERQLCRTGLEHEDVLEERRVNNTAEEAIENMESQLCRTGMEHEDVLEERCMNNIKEESIENIESHLCRAGLEHEDVLEERQVKNLKYEVNKKIIKTIFSSKTKEKFPRKIKQPCPHCGKKILSQRMSLHLRRVHNNDVNTQFEEIIRKEILGPGEVDTFDQEENSVVAVEDSDLVLNNSNIVLENFNLVVTSSAIKKEIDAKVEEMIFTENSCWGCKKCGKVMKKKQHIKNHAESHLKGYSHPCPICGKCSKTRNALQNHISYFHKHPMAKIPFTLL